MHKDSLPAGRDMVVTVRKDVSARSLQEISRELEELLKKRSAEI